MLFKAFSLILCLIINIYLSLSESSTEQCFLVYICCIRSENKCLEYCEPKIECQNNFVEITDDKIGEDKELITTTTERILDETGNFTAVLNPKLCRLGHRLVKNQCRKVF